MFEIPKRLHMEMNWFKSLLHISSKEVVDPESGEPSMFFKMTLGSDVQVFADKSKSQMIVEMKRAGRWAYNWDVFDVDGGQHNKIGVITWNPLKTVARFGAEAWKIKGPDGDGEILELNAEGDSAMKRVVDAMSKLIYNPSHAYVIQTPGGERVATIAARHGWWRQYYDFELEGGTANEKKLAVAMFASLLLYLKK